MARRSWGNEEPDYGKLALQAIAVFLAVAIAVFVGRVIWLNYAVGQISSAFQGVSDAAAEANRKAAAERRRAAEANERAERRRAEEARLKPGERCMGGRFARQIGGDARRWESDSSQDWKCNRRL